MLKDKYKGLVSASTKPFTKIAVVTALLILLFQIGHFAEHAFQFLIWILGDFSNICGRDQPWMSPVALFLSGFLADVFAPAAVGPRRMMLGMEILHLIGNSVFLVGLFALYYVLPHRLVRWACLLETFHLYEHVMLTVSTIFIGKPIGMSTLFGASFSFDNETTVGIRVTWHFVMNLLPMPLAMIAIVNGAKGSPSVPISKTLVARAVAVTT